MTLPGPVIGVETAFPRRKNGGTTLRLHLYPGASFYENLDLALLHNALLAGHFPKPGWLWEVLCFDPPFIEILRHMGTFS
jgi:hypothetical protein